MTIIISPSGEEIGEKIKNVEDFGFRMIWMECFQYKNRNTFRENYINPLKRLGFIESTIPETPNAPDNKYALTDLGRAFLIGR